MVNNRVMKDDAEGQKPRNPPMVRTLGGTALGGVSAQFKSGVLASGRMSSMPAKYSHIE
jgi:hypothetical protein